MVFLTIAVALNLQAFLNDVFDRPTRIQRVNRILEDPLPLTPQLRVNMTVIVMDSLDLLNLFPFDFGNMLFNLLDFFFVVVLNCVVLNLLF